MSEPCVNNANPADDNESDDPGPTRKRAAKACQRCRRRRERCDVALRGTPCSRCEQARGVECVLAPTRRGKHARKPPASSQRLYDATTTPTAGSPIRNSAGSGTYASRQNEPRRQNQNQSTAADAGMLVMPQQDTPASSSNTFSRSAQPRQLAQVAATPRLDQGGAGGCPTSHSVNTSVSSSAVDSYRELTWTGLFRHLVEDGRIGSGSEELVDKCAITYLGESFPLSMILENLAEGLRPVLHHAGPSFPEREVALQGMCEHMSPSSSLPREDLDWLETKGVFQFPESQLLAGLKAAFIDKFFPLYPIVHLDETLQQIEDRTIPWILLHAICLVGAGLCPASVLHQAGYSRREARDHFYAKAKALFDFNHEINKVVLLQTAVMMGFSLGRPNEYWNFWTWHSTSVTIAETIGAHRSMAASRIQYHDRSLLRRLWWVIVLRDISGSSLIGRPFRINMQHCDMEMLTAEDFEHDVRSRALESHPLRSTYGLYQIHMSKVASKLRQIILTRYGPARSSDESNFETLRQGLDEWYSELPPVFKDHEGLAGETFGRALCMVYQQHLILLNLGHPGDSSTTATNNREAVINDSAHTILSLANKIVRQSLSHRTPHEAFPPLFLAQVVFLKQTKSKDQGVVNNARTALNLCQLLWYTIGEAWDSGPWVMELFDKMAAVLDRPQQKTAPVPAGNVDIDMSITDLMDADLNMVDWSTYFDFSLENSMNFGEFSF